MNRTPDPYVYNSASVKVVPTVAGISQSLTNSPSGLNWWIESFIGFQCKLDFVYYPFDVQECKFVVSSTKYAIGPLLPDDAINY
jgi:hypothetical protein